MNITTHPGNDTTTVVLEGRFDAHESPHAAETFDGIIGDGQTSIAVSLADVQFIDSTALAQLVRVMKRCRELGGEFSLRNPSNPVLVILELTALDKAFTIVHSDELAA
jgi:anti-sigma B factor antagonist